MSRIGIQFGDMFNLVEIASAGAMWWIQITTTPTRSSNFLMHSLYLARPRHSVLLR